jgi:hypothetical protein
MDRAKWYGVTALATLLGCTAMGAAAIGCTVPADSHHVGDGGVHGDAGVPVNPNCDPSVDSDSDGIADDEESAFDIHDADMDGMLNQVDTDSDGDGMLDADEHGPVGPCSAVDTDRDGIPDFLDTDSDNDGLSDADEHGTTNTSPTNTDTDGDGFTDLAEIAASTDPTDPASRIPDTDFFVILPYMGPHVVKQLDFATDLRVADVYFLVDATGSMGGPIRNVQTSLADIAMRVRGTIPDVQFGVGYIEDFPFHDGLFPSPMHPYFGGDGDEAYHHQQDITDDLGAVDTALAALVRPDSTMPSGYTAIGNGGDGNESQVIGLYQTATGEGGSWTFTRNGTMWSLPPRECPAAPDDPGRRRGYPCFRPGSLPIVVMVTDVEFHNGQTSFSAPYTDITPDPQHITDAADAMNRLGARYIGVGIRDDSGMWTHGDHDFMATTTGSVDASGAPLVYPASMGEVGDQVVMAIETLALHTPMDVTTEADDWQPNPDGVDATQFIKSITAIEGYGPGAGEGYDHHDDTTFYRVVPGTRLRFDVDFQNDFRMPAATAQIFRAKIAVIGNFSARLDERNVYIIVPPDHVSLII